MLQATVKNQALFSLSKSPIIFVYCKTKSQLLIFADNPTTKQQGVESFTCNFFKGLKKMSAVGGDGDLSSADIL